MRLHRTTTALAALLVVGSLGACADYTTTGVPSDEDAAEESDHGAEGNLLQGKVTIKDCNPLRPR